MSGRPRRHGKVVREGRSWLARGLRVDAPLVVTELPREVPFGFLAQLLPTSETGELRLSLRRIPTQAALDLAERTVAVAEAEIASGENARGARPAELETEAESARTLAAGIAASEQELWRAGLSWHAFGPGRETAERRRHRLGQRLAQLGFRARPPEFEAGLLEGTADPAGDDRRPSSYWHSLSTDSVAAFFPFVEEGIHEPGGILVGLLLEDANPTFLNRWSHASYSWGVFGTTGSGKSFAAALWALRTRWLRPEVELFVLDPLGQFGGLGRALAGAVVRLGTAGAERLNALDPATTGGDRALKASRVGAMLRALFPTLTDEEAARLEGTLGKLLASDGPTPTWSSLLAAVEGEGGPDRLTRLLEVFRSGSLRHLDGPTTASLDASPLVLDLSGIPAEQLPFHLTYALDAVSARLKANDRPKLLIVDEAHYLVRHPATASLLDQLVRHVRHYGAGLIVLSQSPDDFLASEAGRSLLRNLRATFLLRLPEVSSAVRTFFDLTEAEAAWLPRARLPTEAGYAEGLLRFGPMHLPLAVVATTPEFDVLHRWLPSSDPATGAASMLRVERHV